MPRQKSTPSKHGIDNGQRVIDENVAITPVDQKLEPLKLEPAMLPEVKLEDPIDFDTESGIGANDSSTAASIQDGDVDEMETEWIENTDEIPENEASEKPMKGFALSVLNPKILSWIDSKYKIEEGARTAVQDIISLYKYEFPKDAMYVPLQNYQVGQLIRKVFPTIGRCKISVGGKRHWVYKNLGRRDHNPLVPQIATSGLSGFKSFEKNFDKIGSDRSFSPAGSDRSSISNHEPPQNTHQDVTGYQRQKLFESLPTMMGYWEASEESASLTSSGGNDYDNYAIVSAAKRRKTLMNSHTIDNEVVQWIRDNYEAHEGFYVKSLELLAHYNSNNPRKPLQNLSQVGRLLKNSINQQCKHLRRYFKGTDSGGKREWVYTNIRVKPHAQAAFNKAVEGSDQSWMASNQSNPTESGPSSPKAAESPSPTKSSENSQTAQNSTPKEECGAASPEESPNAQINDTSNGPSSNPNSTTQNHSNHSSNNSMSSKNQNFNNRERQNGHHQEHSLEILKDLHFDGWFQTVLNSRYTEWVKPVMDFLIDQKRVVIEVRISDDWEVEVHAHGRKVYPESLQISHVDHSINGVKEFLQNVSLLHFCRGFPAPYYRALEIQGHIVSHPEIWSTRSDPEKEEIRHRSINCSLLHKSEGNFCSSCFHSCRLNMQRIKSPVQD